MSDPSADRPFDGTVRARAAAARDAGDLKTALDLLQAGLEQRPDDPGLLFDLAGLLRRIDLPEDAAAIYAGLAERFPDDPGLRHNMATALAAAGQADQAVAILHRLVETAAEPDPHLFALGDALAGAGRTGQAGIAHGAVIARNPGRPEGYVHLAELRMDSGDHAGAADLLRRARRLDPADDGIRYNLGCAELAAGDFDRGWADFEGRLDPRRANAVARRLAMPRWDGGSLHGRHLFVTAEQGIGDQIWLSPAVRTLLREASSVTLEATGKLVPLLRASYPTATVLPLEARRQGLSWVAAGISATGPETADLHVPLGSVPLYRWESMRAESMRGPLLAPPESVVADWRARLAAYAPGPFVGLAWRSTLLQRWRMREYLDLATLVPLLRRLDAVVICLQYGDVEDELDSVWQRYGVHVVRFPELDLFDDIVGTAALVAALDLVVATSVWIAPLAGALGRPTVLAGNSTWLRPQDGRDPLLSQIRSIVPGPDCAWPHGVVNRAADIAADLCSRAAGH